MRKVKRSRTDESCSRHFKGRLMVDFIFQIPVLRDAIGGGGSGDDLCSCESRVFRPGVGQKPPKTK